ncbi:MAG: flagellar M-ring protein FliF [Hahellaceae bacterium]|jgi:flagellar M-ring protein FliF|nr:flagellar M-ring protein FliF [Hahellaceae bacterium]MCP5213247.1 flagellar M-ring protein FliF [Hahellaceae bacterium]
MASLPAELDSGAAQAADPQSDMLLGFNRLNLLRQVGLMVGLAASVALGLAVVLWARDPSFQPLLSNMQNYDPTEVSTVLNEMGIEYRIDPKSGVLLVESEQVYNARLKLAAAGIKDQQTSGFEILDKEQGLGTSQFMETARYRRGLEGELSRTIASLRSVRSARVHLAIPKSSVFVRDTRKPSGSVFLELFGGRDISREQVESIVNLVAASVPEMDSKDVTVVDQRGNLLSKTDVDPEAQANNKDFEYTRKLEAVLNSRVGSILDPIIGRERFRSEVSADIDFTSVESAEEVFNPDLQALRSEYVVDEQRVSGADGGVPGALSNQPPGGAAVPENGRAQTGGGNGGLADVRKQATRNYEVDRSVSYTKHQKGQVRRLTVAVVVDDIKKVNPENGEVSFIPWPEAELERLTILVRNAVGYSASRGDSVSVINTPFAPLEVIPYTEPQFWEQPWFRDLIKPVLAGLIVLILVIGLLRPTLKSLASSGQNEKDLALVGDEEGLSALGALEGGSALDKVTLSATDDFLLPGASEGFDKQMNALKGLVAEDPARVAQVVRQWVNADE